MSHTASMPNSVFKKQTKPPNNQIILYGWFLMKPDRGNHNSGSSAIWEVAIGGYRHPGMTEFCGTRPVVQRLERWKLRTSDGFDVALMGMIDVEKSIANGFSPWLVQSFMIGFPTAWIHLLLTLNKGAPKGSCFPRTLSTAASPSNLPGLAGVERSSKKACSELPSPLPKKENPVPSILQTSSFTAAPDAETRMAISGRFSMGTTSGLHVRVLSDVNSAPQEHRGCEQADTLRNGYHTSMKADILVHQPPLQVKKPSLLRGCLHSQPDNIADEDAGEVPEISSQTQTLPKSRGCLNGTNRTEVDHAISQSSLLAEAPDSVAETKMATLNQFYMATTSLKLHDGISSDANSFPREHLGHHEQADTLIRDGYNTCPKADIPAQNSAPPNRNSTLSRDCPTSGLDAVEEAGESPQHSSQTQNSPKTTVCLYGTNAGAVLQGPPIGTNGIEVEDVILGSSLFVAAPDAETRMAALSPFSRATTSPLQDGVSSGANLVPQENLGREQADTFTSGVHTCLKADSQVHKPPLRVRNPSLSTESPPSGPDNVGVEDAGDVSESSSQTQNSPKSRGCLNGTNGTEEEDAMLQSSYFATALDAETRMAVLSPYSRVPTSPLHFGVSSNANLVPQENLGREQADTITDRDHTCLKAYILVHNPSLPVNNPSLSKDYPPSGPDNIAREDAGEVSDSSRQTHNSPRSEGCLYGINGIEDENAMLQSSFFTKAPNAETRTAARSPYSRATTSPLHFGVSSDANLVPQEHLGREQVGTLGDHTCLNADILVQNPPMPVRNPSLSKDYPPPGPDNVAGADAGEVSESSRQTQNSPRSGGCLYGTYGIEVEDAILQSSVIAAAPVAETKMATLSQLYKATTSPKLHDGISSDANYFPRQHLGDHEQVATLIRDGDDKFPKADSPAHNPALPVKNSSLARASPTSGPDDTAVEDAGELLQHSSQAQNSPKSTVFLHGTNASEVLLCPFTAGQEKKEGADHSEDSSGRRAKDVAVNEVAEAEQTVLPPTDILCTPMLQTRKKLKCDTDSYAPNSSQSVVDLYPDSSSQHFESRRLRSETPQLVDSKPISASAANHISTSQTMEIRKRLRTAMQSTVADIIHIAIATPQPVVKKPFTNSAVDPINTSQTMDIRMRLRNEMHSPVADTIPVAMATPHSAVNKPLTESAVDPISTSQTMDIGTRLRSEMHSPVAETIPVAMATPEPALNKPLNESAVDPISTSQTMDIRTRLRSEMHSPIAGTIPVAMATPQPASNKPLTESAVEPMSTSQTMDIRTRLGSEMHSPVTNTIPISTVTSQPAVKKPITDLRVDPISTSQSMKIRKRRKGEMRSPVADITPVAIVTSQAAVETPITDSGLDHMSTSQTMVTRKRLRSEVHSSVADTSPVATVAPHPAVDTPSSDSAIHLKSTSQTMVITKRARRAVHSPINVIVRQQPAVDKPIAHSAADPISTSQTMENRRRLSEMNSLLSDIIPAVDKSITDSTVTSVSKSQTMENRRRLRSEMHSPLADVMPTAILKLKPADEKSATDSAADFRSTSQTLGIRKRSMVEMHSQFAGLFPFVTPEPTVNEPIIDSISAVNPTSKPKTMENKKRLKSEMHSSLSDIIPIAIVTPQPANLPVNSGSTSQTLKTRRRVRSEMHSPLADVIPTAIVKLKPAVDKPATDSAADFISTSQTLEIGKRPMVELHSSFAGLFPFVTPQPAVNEPITDSNSAVNPTSTSQTIEKRRRLRSQLISLLADIIPIATVTPQPAVDKSNTDSAVNSVSASQTMENRRRLRSKMHSPLADIIPTAIVRINPAVDEPATDSATDIISTSRTLGNRKGPTVEMHSPLAGLFPLVTPQPVANEPTDSNSTLLPTSTSQTIDIRKTRRREIHSCVAEIISGVEQVVHPGHIIQTSHECQRVASPNAVPETEADANELKEVLLEDEEILKTEKDKLGIEAIQSWKGKTNEIKGRTTRRRKRYKIPRNYYRSRKRRWASKGCCHR